MNRILSAVAAAVAMLCRIVVATIREHFVAVTFTATSVLLLAIAPWYERLLICLSFLSGMILIMRIADYDGLPTWLA